MRLIIIEDDSNKLKAILSHLQKYKDIEISTYASYQSGLRAILLNKFDLLLLDMSMPAYDTGRPLPLAGRDILFLLKRKKITLKTIIITQYENFDGTSLNSLHINLNDEFPNNYLGYVYYNVTQDSWKQTLDSFFLKVNCKENQSYDTDISCR